MSTYLYSTFDFMSLSCHVRVSEWIYTLSMPECQGTACWNRCVMWSLSDSNGIRTQKQLVHKRRPNWPKKLSCVVITYLYGAFDCMLSCHVGVSEWICTLQLSECQGTPCSKQAQYLKFKWQQTHKHLVGKRSLNHLAKLAKKIELCCDYLLGDAFDCMLSCYVRILE